MKRIITLTIAISAILAFMMLRIAEAQEPSPTPVPPTTGSITVAVDTDPETNNIGFGFDFDPGADIVGLEDDESVTRADLNPGDYRIIADPSPGWLLTDIDCTGDEDTEIDVDARQVVIDLDAGESVSCEFNYVPAPTPVPPTAIPPTIPPLDVCANIAGAQSTVPVGLVLDLQGGQQVCIAPPTQAPAPKPVVRPPSTGDAGLK